MLAVGSLEKSSTSLRKRALSRFSPSCTCSGLIVGLMILIRTSWTFGSNLWVMISFERGERRNGIGRRGYPLQEEVSSPHPRPPETESRRSVAGTHRDDKI